MGPGLEGTSWWDYGWRTQEGLVYPSHVLNILLGSFVSDQTACGEDKPSNFHHIVIYLAMQASDEIKKMAALDAKLRRLCCPKPLSGKLEVSPEIHKQRAAGGQQRKVLLQVLVRAKGDKAG